jgi:quinol monooxygenase YgiN
MINVVAVIVAHAGKREALLAAFRANLPLVRAEAGCIEYTGAVDLEDFGAFGVPFGPDTLVVIEKWEDADALKAHARAPHMAAYAATTRELVASRAIHVLRTV